MYNKYKAFMKLDLQMFAKSRGVAWIGIGATGATAWDILEGKTEFSESYSNSLINSTDADNTDATFGTYEDNIAGDGEGTFSYTGNYSGGSAQKILELSAEKGTYFDAVFGTLGAPGANPATTDWEVVNCFCTSYEISGDAGIQVLTATIRVNSKPVAATATDTLTASAVGAAGKARGRTTGGAYLTLSGTQIANVLSLKVSHKRGEIESTDADSSGWKTFIPGDYSSEISGSVNDADTTEHKLLKSACQSGTTLTMVYGYRTFSTGVLGKHKYAASGLVSKADGKHGRNGMRTLDFTIKVKGVPTRTD